MLDIIGISGSLRKGSFNTMLVKAFGARMPEGASFELLDISRVPLYNGDLEVSAYPAESARLKERIRKADGVIIATPEYNRSVPGVLKNMIDWTSRPYGDSAWDKKPVFVTGATGGAIGTALAQYALKQSLAYLNAQVPGQPEFYCGGADKKFDAEGNLVDESTKEHIDKALSAFIAFIG